MRCIGAHDFALRFHRAIDRNSRLTGEAIVSMAKSINTLIARLKPSIHDIESNATRIRATYLTCPRLPPRIVVVSSDLYGRTSCGIMAGFNLGPHARSYHTSHATVGTVFRALPRRRENDLRKTPRKLVAQCLVYDLRIYGPATHTANSPSNSAGPRANLQLYRMILASGNLRRSLEPGL